MKNFISSKRTCNALHLLNGYTLYKSALHTHTLAAHSIWAACVFRLSEACLPFGPVAMCIGACVCSPLYAVIFKEHVWLASGITVRLPIELMFYLPRNVNVFSLRLSYA